MDTVFYANDAKDKSNNTEIKGLKMFNGNRLSGLTGFIVIAARNFN